MYNFIVRNEETMRYELKTSKLIDALVKRDALREAGVPVYLICKPKGVNQIQSVSFEDQLAAYAKAGKQAPDWMTK